MNNQNEHVYWRRQTVAIQEIHKHCVVNKVKREEKKLKTIQVNEIYKKGTTYTTHKFIWVNTCDMNHNLFLM